MPKQPGGKGTKRNLESYSDSGDSTLYTRFGQDWKQELDSFDLPLLRSTNKKIKAELESRRAGFTTGNVVSWLADPDLAEWDLEVSKRLEKAEASLLEESEISSINQRAPLHRTSTPEQPSNFHRLFWGSQDQESSILEEGPIQEGEEEIQNQGNRTIGKLVEELRESLEEILSSTDEKMATHQGSQGFGHQSTPSTSPSPSSGHQSPHSGRQSPHSGHQSPHSGHQSPHPEHQSPNPAQNHNPDMEYMLKMMGQLVMSQQQQHQEIGQLAKMIHDSHVRATNTQGHHQGQRTQTFKPQMFRQLDMSKINKDNKLLSEEFQAWQANTERVLKANPDLANQPIDRLTNLILAGIGPKAESRLASLGQNPTFVDLDDFFKRLKTIFCSATVQTDAQEQFEKAKQYKWEDTNSWHARNLLYFNQAHGNQDSAYWNLCLEKFFKGMLDTKLAKKTVKDYVNRQPGGWTGQCNRTGYTNCLTWTLQCQSEEGFIDHLFQDKTVPHRGFQHDSRPPPIPMEMGTVSRNRFKREQMGQTANVNHNGANSGMRPRNPPGGMQKRLQREARGSNNFNKNSRPPFSNNNSTRNGPRNSPQNGTRNAPRDKSKDKCNKCKELGHWARECPNLQSVNATEVENNTAIVQSENDWEQEESMGEWAEDLNVIGNWPNDLQTDLAYQASKASSKRSTKSLN